MRPPVDHLYQVTSSPNNHVSHHNSSRNLLKFDNVLGNNKARWITSLGTKLGEEWDTQIELKDFVLPGSHNSAAVNMASNWCTSSGANLLPQTRNQVAKCQDTGLLDQLHRGIRYLDLRVVDSADFHGVKYPLHHEYLVDDSVNNMEKALTTISGFLDRNPGEFVISRIKYQRCDSNEFQYGGIKNEIGRLADTLGRVRRYNSETLDLNIVDLRGKLFIDIEGHHNELYKFGIGVDGPEYRGSDGNPFEVARNIRNEKFDQQSNE